MAITAFVYGNAAKHTHGDSFLANDIRCALVASSYTPDQDAHEFWSSVVAHEITGPGYTANGQALAGKTVGYTGGTNKLKFDSNDPAWANSTITARYAIFYDRTPATDASRPLIVYVDFGQDFVSTNGPFTITIDANGIMTITAA